MTRIDCAGAEPAMLQTHLAREGTRAFKLVGRTRALIACSFELSCHTPLLSFALDCGTTPEAGALATV